MDEEAGEFEFGEGFEEVEGCYEGEMTASRLVKLACFVAEFPSLKSK